jgi:calcineurin-like phosphoesterase family protein
MTNIFFSSDWHLGHRNIIRLSERPFEDLDEMLLAMIETFNEQAAPEDIIHLVGDACMGQLAESLPLIAKINAHVILHVGNHDRPSRAMQRKGDIEAKIAKEQSRYEQYFSQVLLDSTTRTIELRGKRFAISHYPYEGDHFTEDRHPELRPKKQGLPLIHGHVHNLWKFNGSQFNVGVDVNDFKLVTEDEVLDWAASL